MCGKLEMREMWERWAMREVELWSEKPYSQSKVPRRADRGDRTS